ncbi:competence/damage-inducible protein A [Rhodocytophaga aerolata]|uniref:CinA-like protein n=1 Tax=Rhodocytophaga aerolata TaxID=455078 RepID=A0ABT8RDC7_9BACT|nr:competence/damage-inducible protein A [Rhodocytophaga aerolata]MDO1450096.1 competence/damage-inducible protein A [Rhodocytophaga aerolata]
MKHILAEVITIGDEILYGQITDTNTQWISTELDKLGIRTVRKSSVGDDKERILEILQEAESRADIILITGGLGPTKDDITKNVLAQYFNSTLVIHEQALMEVTAYFKSKGKELTEINRSQAALPDTCTFISNKRGTAPGMWFEKNGKVFVSMPGVPHEMKGMMTDTILSKLQKHFETPVIYHKMIKTVGIGESFLATKIEQWEDNLPPHIKLAYLPTMGQVRLRLTATGTDLATLQADVEAQTTQLQSLVSDYIYGYDNDTLESVTSELLLKHRYTIAVAESCSVGYISYSLGSVAGCSQYFMGSIVAYSNEAKINLLDVNRNTLEKYGAVSEETVKEMAQQVRLKFNTSIGMASSGIAGPSGGSEDKPVGTVWIAYADGKQTVARRLQLGNDRDLNIKLTAVHVLNLLRQSIY